MTAGTKRGWLLVGAGGHAKAIVETIRSQGGDIDAYVDERTVDWLAARRIPGDAEAIAASARPPIAIGFGATSPNALRRRLALVRRYLDAGFSAPPVVHPVAFVSASARLESAVVVLGGAVVQPAASIGTGAIVNSRALVEHDSVIGAGAHVAPGAIVLGGCKVGDCAMLGAGSVLIQGGSLADFALVPAAALSRGQ